MDINKLQFSLSLSAPLNESDLIALKGKVISYFQLIGDSPKSNGYLVGVCAIRKSNRKSNCPNLGLLSKRMIFWFSYYYIFLLHITHKINGQIRDSFLHFSKTAENFHFTGI